MSINVPAWSWTARSIHVLPLSHAGVAATPRDTMDTTSPFDLDDPIVERYILDDASGVASLDGGDVILDFVDPDGPGRTDDRVGRPLGDGCRPV